MKVVFSDRAYASVLAETTEKIQTETGGLFLGAVQNGIWYIIEAIDPGPKSIFEVAYFEYDQKYTQHLINKIANLYDQPLALIGLWHRHPGSFDQFSTTDDGTNAKYASMRKEGAISALVNIDPKFRITMYRVDRPSSYRKVPYDVGDNLIPDEFLKFKSPERFNSIMDNLLHPAAATRRYAEGYRRSASLASFMKFILPQLENDECTEHDEDITAPEEEFVRLSPDDLREKLTDEIFDDICFMADELNIETKISLDGDRLIVYQEAIDKTIKLLFGFSGTEQTVTLSYEDKSYVYHSGLLTESYEKADSERKDHSDRIDRQRKQPGVIEYFINKIKSNRNED